MAKVAPAENDAPAIYKSVDTPSRKDMVRKAKALGLSERLGNGKAFSRTTMQDIGELGIGIQLYFMLIKYSAIVLVIMSICAIPGAVLNYYGHGVLAANADPLKLTYLSVANQGVNPAVAATECMANGGTIDCTGETISTPLTEDPKVASYIISGCDCAASIVFWCFIGIFGYLSRRAVRQDAVENSTPAKYAVRVKGLPRDATEEEILAHFNERYDLSKPERHYPLWLGCFGRPRPPRRLTKVPGNVATVANVDHVDGSALYMGKWVAQVSIARPTGGFLRHFLSLESLTKQIAGLNDVIAAYRQNPTKYAKKLTAAELSLARLQAKMDKTTQKMKSLKKHGLKRLQECECAYVVFENTESRRRCLQDYRTSTSGWKRRWQPATLRFRQTYAIVVEAAPEPSNIIWENLETTPTSRFLRRSLTNVLTFLLLLLSCAVISLANSSQRKFNTAVIANVCDKIAAVYQGPATSWGEPGTLVWNESATCAVDSFAIEFADKKPTPFPPGILPYNDLHPPTNYTRCVEPCFNTTINSCGTLPCFTTDQQLTSTNASAKCESYAASTILTCYCTPLLAASIRTDGVINGPKKLWTDLPPCQSYITAYLTKTSLLIAAALTVIAVNVGLQGIFYAFAAFERHSSESHKAAAVVLKLFCAQWINTAVIVLIVNASLGYVPLVSSLLSGQFQDFERNWYTSVGAGLTMTMLINAVGPQVGPLVAMYFTYPLLRCLRSRSAVTQAQMNELYASPAFNIALRYPVVLNTIFVTLMYSGGLPVLLPVGAIALGLNFVLDKLTILKLCSVRTAFDEALGSLALRLLPWVLWLHLGFSAWMFGNSTILPSDLLSIRVVLDALAPSIGSVEIQEDPTAIVQAAIQANMAEASSVVRTIYQYLLKAFLKVIRLDTFPVFFLLVLLTLWMLFANVLFPVLMPLLRLTLGVLAKIVYRLLKRATVRPALGPLDDDSPFSPFSALFERHVGPVYRSDSKKGFSVDDQGRLVRCWPNDVEFDGGIRTKGSRMRTWEAFAAPVKTYAIEKNPKYKVSWTVAGGMIVVWFRWPC
ncbi:transmembrane protein [Achlya hypogyna]|uniref:Transmembrane protein n=1 Tax=Achlya hypogyna TaxID=1202772 RepID=A0A1V9Z5S5_ACHHY|nr:transmembrane protein [Achlya hypogyna]